MKILLVATNRVVAPFPVYPIGIDYVAAGLRARHDVRVLDMAADGAESLLRESCRTFAPDLVGLSIRNIDSAETTHAEGFVPVIEGIVDLIRASCSARIVLGGPGFSIFPQALMRRLRADFGVVGEGESLPGLIDALERSPGAPVELPGLLSGRGTLTRAEPWAGPRRRILASTETVAHYLRWGGMLNIQTKRGCPYLCSYCTYPGIEGRKLRLFAPEDVADEWQGLVAAGAKFIFVTDAVFNSHTRHNLAVAEAVRGRGLTTPWGAFFSPVRPRPGYYRGLREAGLTHVEFGTESLSPRMLAGYRKPFTVEHAVAAHHEARSAGLHVAHYLLLGGPGEDRDTLDQTLDACERLDDAALFFFCGVRVYPGTPLHTLAVREGQVAPDDDLLSPHFYRPAALGLDEIRARVEHRSRGRRHWVLGSGDTQMIAVQRRLYQRGAVGPLWDRLVPG
jgi:radical SAM superfamily enzyme YgiQ (UPF0313 family)